MSKSVVILTLVLMTVSWAEELNSKIRSPSFPYSLGLLGFDYDPNFKHEIFTYLDRKESYEGDLPSYLDTRMRFSICSHRIGNIMDQGKCAASYAFAPLEVMSIQLCLWTRGKMNITFSPEDLISCCDYCGKGCDGGYLDMTLPYLEYNGVVTGSDYNIGRGCKPFSEGAFKYGITQRCQRTCQKKYSKTYNEDLHVVAFSEEIKSNVEAMQRKLYASASVIVSFAVYDDFANYKGGVYSRRKNAVHVGNHVARLVGYGTENGVPYWLAANSWGTKWGIGGFFKIKRGTNECGIEQEPITLYIDELDHQKTTIRFDPFTFKPYTFEEDDDEVTTKNFYSSDERFSSAQTDTINYRLALGLMSLYFIFGIL